MEITIDEKKFAAREGQTILEVARTNGVEIPHLCWHPALDPYGACRVCLVEVERRGWKQLTTSCTYPVRDGLVVYTDTEKVKEARKFSISLLLLLAPEARRIKELADRYGVRTPPDVERTATNCIRCGLCIRACRELIGREAIGFVGRGIDRIPETPFQEDNPVCLSCGACAFLCPTGKIKITDLDFREIEPWHRKEKLAVCPECGKKFAPVSQLKELKAKISNRDLEKIFDLCPECRKKRISKTFADGQVPSDFFSQKEA